MPQAASLTILQLEVIARKAADDFQYFLDNIFALSFDEYTSGQYVHDVATHMGQHSHAMYITGRGHFKSTRLYARAMWRILRLKYYQRSREGWYFSYNADMSSYHLQKIRELISRNIFYRDATNFKIQTDSVLGFAWVRKGMDVEHSPKYIMKPAGLLVFKRGIHADDIYVDDPLKDPENKLRPTVIFKVNRIIKTELLPMVNKGGECYVVGTPQTNDDFFFDADLQTLFATWFTPAVLDRRKGIALWPEWLSFEELMKIERAITPKIFAQEYMASPVYNEDSYLNRDQVINASVELCWPKKDWDEALADEYVVAGFDIGKKVHPSHLAIFIRTFYTDEDGNTLARFRQIYSYWMDGWKYEKQYKYLNDIIGLFNISILYYDNTRAEFEGFAEQGLLNPAMAPVVLNARNETKMAANMDALLERGDVTFINERRQQSQLLAVDNTLDAMESPEGHGDSFWSVGMALQEQDDGSISIRSV